MNKNVQLLGIIGLVSLIVGLLTFFMVSSEQDQFHFAQIHFLLGGLLCGWFIIRGGLQHFGKIAVKRATGMGIGMVLYVVLFLGILVLANYFFARHDPLTYDSTEQKVYTLAPQTIKTLSALNAPVIARAFYLGAEVPGEVQDILQRMSKETPNFSWQAIDPEKNPGLAEKFGVNEKDTVHFSFKAEGSTRQVKIVRKVDEQEIVNALLKLTRGGERVVYYVTGHGETELNEPAENGYLFLKEAIQGENMDLRELALAQGTIPADTSALLVMAPKRDLLPGEISAIEAYLAGGGSAIFASDPKPPQTVRQLLGGLGIELGNDVVLDQVVRLFAGPGMGFQPVVTSYGPHPITGGFTEGTLFTTVTSVRKLDTVPPGALVTELAFTSDKSWAETQVDDALSEEPKAALDADDIRGPISIAAAFEGKPDFGHSVETQSTTDKKSRVVVFGDSDFVNNLNLRQLFNRDLFLNAVNWVVGEDGGISIRSGTLRASTQALTAQQFRGIFLLTALLLPELVVLWGFTVWWFRKS